MAGHTIEDALRRAVADADAEPTNGPDSLLGSESRDTISLLRGNDTYSGLGGSDLIYGNEGRDLLSGNAGRDRIYGGMNADTVYGGDGSDFLYGNLGDDWVYGERGNDAIYGNEGRDQLFGGDGRDTLFGGQGNDVLEGGAGDDSIVGGRGNDTAVFSGTRASYAITKNRDGSFTLDGASGRDHVETVEHFRFDDGTFDVNTLLTGNPGNGGTPQPPPAPINQAPIANSDTAIVRLDKDQSLNLNLLTNDNDPEKDPLKVGSVVNGTISVNSLPIVGGITKNNADNSFQISSNDGQLSLLIKQTGEVQYTGSPIMQNQNVIFTFGYSNIDSYGASSNQSSGNVQFVNPPVVQIG